MMWKYKTKLIKDPKIKLVTNIINHKLPHIHENNDEQVQNDPHKGPKNKTSYPSDKLEAHTQRDISARTNLYNWL